MSAALQSAFGVNGRSLSRSAWIIPALDQISNRSIITVALVKSRRKAISTLRAKRSSKNYDVADLGLAAEGIAASCGPTSRCRCCATSANGSPRPSRCAGMRLGACLHITCETANLLRALKAGGAEVLACASNPLSTQDDVAAALVEHEGIACYAIHGEDRDTYYSHLRAVIDSHPRITMDDGADLVSLLHTELRRPGRRGGRQHGGDHHRRDPAARDGTGRRAARFRWSRSTTPKPSICSTTAMAPANRRSRRSCAPPASCWPARSWWWRATDGADAGSLRAPTDWAPTSS